MYEGQDKTHLALAGSGISAQSLVLVCPPQHAGQRQRCNDPAQSAVRVFHGCDLTAIQTTHKKSTPPSRPMNETPNE
jgi:hypothetical protein